MAKRPPVPLETISDQKLEVYRCYAWETPKPKNLIMWGLAEGYTRSEIATVLGVSPETVSSHISSIQERFLVKGPTYNLAVVAALSKPQATPPAPFKQISSDLMQQCRQAATKLTSRESQVLIRLGAGYPTGRIATSLSINKSSVVNHFTAIRKKFGITGESVSRLAVIAAHIVHEKVLDPPMQDLAACTLSKREKCDVSGLAGGYTNHQITRAMGINEKTASSNVAHIRDRFFPEGKSLKIPAMMTTHSELNGISTSPFDPISSTLIEQCRGALEKLSPKENQIFASLGQGQQTASIASSLGISRKTVASHFDHIRIKLGLEGQPLSRLTVIAGHLVKEREPRAPSP